MKKNEYPLADLDDIQYRMSCGIKAISAIHELIEGAGANTPESYSDALFGIFDYLWSLNVELQETINGIHPNKEATA